MPSRYSSNDLVGVRVHRFHRKNAASLESPTLLPFFVDSLRLVAAPGRFAGAQINPGYFFSLSPKAATFEMHYYSRIPTTPRPLSELETLQLLAESGDERVFLSCDGSFWNILNLLWPPTLRETLKACFPQLDSHRIDYPSAIMTLASAASGGNAVTDVLGWYAYRNGYNGIRFPSARALYMERNRPWVSGTLLDGLRYGPISDDDSFYLDDLMQEMHSEATNVVIFRGSYILKNVDRFRIQTASGHVIAWFPNEFRYRAEEEIEQAIVAAGGLANNVISSACRLSIDTVAAFQVGDWYAY